MFSKVLQYLNIQTNDATVDDLPFPDLYEASILDLQIGLDAGNYTSVDLVKVCSSML